MQIWIMHLKKRRLRRMLKDGNGQMHYQRLASSSLARSFSFSWLKQFQWDFCCFAYLRFEINEKKFLLFSSIITSERILKNNKFWLLCFVFRQQAKNFTSWLFSLLQWIFSIIFLNRLELEFAELFSYQAKANTEG